MCGEEEGCRGGVAPRELGFLLAQVGGVVEQRVHVLEQLCEALRDRADVLAGDEGRGGGMGA